MAHNAPEDWGMHWSRCEECGQECHASEGGHECPAPEGEKVEPKRGWLSHSGYKFDPEEMTWSAVIRASSHTARRDHKDGGVKKGHEYQVTVTRNICDDSGESWLDERKCLFKTWG